MSVGSLDLKPGQARPYVARRTPHAHLADVLPLPSVVSDRPARNVKDRLFRMAALLAGIDWLVACMAIFFGLALRVVQRDELPQFLSSFTEGFSPAAMWVLGGGTIYSSLLAFFRVYEPGNLYRMHFLVRNIVKSAMVWSLLVLAIIGLFEYNTLAPRLGILYCAGTLATAGILSRLGALGILMHPRVRQATRSRLLVVGWNDKAANLRAAMQSDMGQLRDILGCIPTPGGRLRVQPPPEVKVLGDYSDLPALVGPLYLDGVILADVNMPAAEIRRLIAFCQREYLSFHLVPEYFPVLGSRLEAKAVSGVPLLGVSHLPLDFAFNRLLKRSFDIVGALAGLVLSIPVIAFFGAIVYMESPGPIIYRQKRTTRGGRDFTIFKIRSMRLNAETESGAVWARRDDPRRLKIGAFMRKMNIDELPQFWNVLKGDMSLVGPRPERPELIERFKDEIPNYNVRHASRAGITGWAAVHGLRGDTDLRQRVEYDIYYVENWSLLLDLYCIAATFLKNKNAH